MSRAEFSKATKRDAFARANGKCEECGVTLFPGEAEFHHLTEDFMGGEPTLDNCKVLCAKCHRDITKLRRATIDKTRRLSDKRMGIKRKSGFRGWRKMNGQVVWNT